MESTGRAPARADVGGPDDTGDLNLARLSLSVREYASAKRYAESAIKSRQLSLADESLADQILAVSRVHVAAETTVADNVRDLYSILDLGDFECNDCTPDTLSFSYRRLCRLLDPSLNPFTDARAALDLVADAYATLSDPERRSLYDTEVQKAAALAKARSCAIFWTACRGCFCLHQYQRAHLGKVLRCPTCQEVFVAAELPAEPPVVEGTDMYYCVWGFFPLGFPGGYRFGTRSKEEEKGKEKEPGGYEAKMAMLEPQSAGRVKQTARKTVCAMRFSLKRKRCEGDEEEEESNGDDG